MTLPPLGCLPGTTTGKQLRMTEIDVINPKESAADYRECFVQQEAAAVLQ